MMHLLRKLRVSMRKTLALRTEQGPYRFLVRKWEDLSDIDVALRVVEIEFFKNCLTPIPLPIEKLRSILVLAPHQDDEIIGAGGALTIASAVGVKIDVLYITDGSGKGSVDGATPANLAQIRDQEAQEVCRKLGARMHRLGISNYAPEPTLRNIDQMSEIIKDVNPEVVMAPWLLDSPAKHRLVNHLLWLANRRNVLPQFEVWGYQVHNSLFPNGYVDITDVAEQKRELLECFRSQNEYKTRYDHLAMGMAAWNARFFNSVTPKYIEIFFTLPLHELLRLVETFYFPNMAATYRGQRNVISGAMALHQEVVSSSPKFRVPSLIRKAGKLSGLQPNR